jgi:hypothetical protein
VELARIDPLLTAMNRNAFQDPRIEAEFGDAFQYLRDSAEEFDAIYLDFPYAMDYNVSRLYSREFFYFVREHLADGGFAVLDAPGQTYLVPEDEGGDMAFVPGGEWEIYYNTIRAAGFETIVPYYSTVEDDNAAAVEFLESWEGTPEFPDPRTGEARPQLRSEWIRRMMAQHRSYMETGFMAMWKGEAPAAGYRDLSIELTLLNEKRFGLSFPPPLPGPLDIDRRRVNSILRPTLPANSIWAVRRPWN